MSFIRKISQKNNDELTSKSDGVFIIDEVYILHETLGVKMVKGWEQDNNEGVIGILLVEGDHQIVVALEDSPENLHWSKKSELVNQMVEEIEEVETDFNGEYYCRKLNSPDFPAAYYCLNYNKGKRIWYLPSSGELLLIYKHLEEIQNALETVGGHKLVTTWDDGVPVYWSSTECSATLANANSTLAWTLGLNGGGLLSRSTKVIGTLKVRPVSKFKI